jgi:hypothetical protein
MRDLQKLAVALGGTFLLLCALAFMARVVKVIYFGF